MCMSLNVTGMSLNVSPLSMSTRVACPTHVHVRVPPWPDASRRSVHRPPPTAQRITAAPLLFRRPPRRVPARGGLTSFNTSGAAGAMDCGVQRHRWCTSHRSTPGRVSCHIHIYTLALVLVLLHGHLCTAVLLIICTLPPITALIRYNGLPTGITTAAPALGGSYAWCGQ